jgi:hypothetical protein
MRAAHVQPAVVSLLSAGLIVRGVLRRRAAVAHSRATLLYLARPSPGKRTGRNVGEHDLMADDLVAVHVATPVFMRDWRSVAEPPTLCDDRFTLLPVPAVGESADFEDGPPAPSSKPARPTVSWMASG